MLLKSHISNIEMLLNDGSKNPVWAANRLGKFTSSNIYKLMEDRSFMTYVEERLGEEMSGVSAEDEIDTSATRHGNMHEMDAIKRFKALMGVEFLVTQKLIFNPESRFSSTPDALIVVREKMDEASYEVEPVEAKCPEKGHRYIKLFRCNTPQDLKVAEKKYYWQVVDQLDNCGALRGWFVAYQPDFRLGNMKVIEFRLMEQVGGKYPLKADLDLLRQKKVLALKMLSDLRKLFIPAA